MLLPFVIFMVLFILVYTWIVYPLILHVLYARAQRKSLSSPQSTHVPRRRGAKTGTPSLQYSISIILSAYNEEAHIGARLENILALDYSQDLIQIHVGLDGCDDRSAELACEWASRHTNIHVYDFTNRRGKVPVLKELVRRGRGDGRTGGPEGGADAPLLVFTDANTMFRPDALQTLVAPFVEPQVGGVCGRLIFTNARMPESSNHPMPEGSYWDWETKLKIAESALDSCLGANGAIYAMRPELFWDEMPDNTLIDDFVLGMKVREQGFRMVYEPDAIAEEELPETAHEWIRRIRIGTGAYQALSFCHRCLFPVRRSNVQCPTGNSQRPNIQGPQGHPPLHNWTFPVGHWTFNSFIFPWTFWSHKVLRWFTPHMLLALIILVSVAFIWSPNLRIIESSNPAAIGIAAGLACLAVCWCGLSRRASLLRHFLTMQAALFVGFIRYCRGGLQGAWTRTPRGV